MADALQTSTPPITPEVLSLIKAGSPAPKTPNPILNPAASATPVAVPAAETAAAEVKPAAARPRIQKDAQPVNEALVSVTLRLPAGIPTSLLRASAERKLKKISPFTQQDIAAEALTEWLKKHGYLS